MKICFWAVGSYLLTTWVEWYEASSSSLLPLEFMTLIALGDLVTFFLTGILSLIYGRGMSLIILFLLNCP